MSSSSDQSSTTMEPVGRFAGGTEYSWCKSVPSGTGITVMSFLLSRDIEKQTVESAVQFLQNCHPILRARIVFDSSQSNYLFNLSSSYTRVLYFDESETANITSSCRNGGGIDLSEGTVLERFHLILEHELNKNDWSAEGEEKTNDLLVASIYALGGGHNALMLRAHTAVCDRSSAVTLMRELQVLIAADYEDGDREKLAGEVGYNLEIEKLIPADKAKKPFWMRGVDVLGYSLNSFRFSSIDFVDTASKRLSQVVRLEMSRDDTQKLLTECQSRSIKLCGVLVAASFIAARSTKNLPIDRREKFAAVTLIDCRSILDPSLQSNQMGFYHSAIMNSHDVTGNEELWQLASRCYTSFANGKKNNKHFTDMKDVNFLMNMAIDKPSLTISGAMRTTFISVFEESVIESSSNSQSRAAGIVDYVGCSSVHGIGPSIAIFDTLRDGELDCACVYPSPLHTREQMEKLVDNMKTILLNGSGSSTLTNGLC